MCKNWDRAEAEYNKYDMPYDYGLACEECEAQEMDLCTCEKEGDDE